jgi:lipoprotein-anchoring transpeptidase ErfK/SrfK
MQLKSISRRQFLKYSSLGLLGLTGGIGLTMPSRAQAATEPANNTTYGRVIDETLQLYEQPSLDARKTKSIYRDAVLPITDVIVGDTSTTYNRVWYELNHEGFANSGGVQPVHIAPNAPTSTIPADGCLGEVTVPFTDTRWWPGLEQATVYRIYYSTTHWVVSYNVDHDGAPWYGLMDDRLKSVYYAQASHIRLIEPSDLAPLSSDVPPDAKRLEVHLDEQIVIAYEFDRPVFMSRAATGGKFSNGDFTTPKGRHIIYSKRGSRHMAAGDRAAANSYDLPGIPWISYITEDGIAFHGTYWHNDFGHPRSHGCVNLSPQAARWIYLWSNPVVPPEKPSNYDPNGTVVDVI